MEKASKIVVAGSNGMVGSAIIRELKKIGFTNIITSTSKEMDIRNQNAGVEMSKFYKKQYRCNFISGMSSDFHGINDNFDAIK